MRAPRAAHSLADERVAARKLNGQCIAAERDRAGFDVCGGLREMQRPPTAALEHEPVMERERAAADFVRARLGAAPRAVRPGDEIQRRPSTVDEEQHAVDLCRVSLDDVAGGSPGAMNVWCLCS